MAEVRFYHLQRSALEVALPKLLERIHGLPARAVLLAGSDARVEFLASKLWEYSPDSFLPHGTPRDGHASRQPIYMTTEPGNPNGAKALVLVDGVDAPLDGFEMIFDIFDGRDDMAVEAARNRYRNAKAAGHMLKYFQQTDKGWEQKA
ncbi:DNA polymerase III subunit chi [Lacibacterium aquatile]|uniref:DNA polymerase III subunit chi n=1 Tax=Lacibacterium aquatile TaxID=1168082 RepID=A0ABW5DLK4_9PROT